VATALDRLPDEARARLKKRPQPSWTQPMLARLSHDYFSDSDWIYERKFDGERCLAFRRGNDVRLLSRNRKGLNAHYPEIADALREQKEDDFIVDGEIVAFEGNVTSFSRLQKRMQVSDPEEARHSGVAVYYYVFDILHLDGQATTRVALRHRKSILKSVFYYGNRLRFTAHRNREGEKYLREACRRGWEGIIAKRADSIYRHSRSSDWLKFKCVNQQEFVIGGYTEPQGSRIGFGALLVGYYEDDDLRYAGKVGTGYDEDMLRRLSDRLTSIERKTCPFGDTDIATKGVHWVQPKLVGEVGFTEWTSDGRLRHPRFLGLRRDKAPEDVVRERAEG